MKKETIETEQELIEVLDNLGIEVTETAVTEYVRGDPTTDDATVTGAEIKLTAYLSYDTDVDDDSPFRVK